MSISSWNTRDRRPRFAPPVALAIVILSTSGIMPGCDRPLKDVSEAELRQAMRGVADLELQGVESRDIPLIRTPSNLLQDFSPERLEELDAMAGPVSYEGYVLDLGDNLTGQPLEEIRVGLEEAVHSAVTHNLTIQIASINPAVAESQVVAAESRFDYTLFGSVDWSKLDEPTPIPVISGFEQGTGVSASDNHRFGTGIRKNLITGGVVEVITELNRLENRGPATAQIIPDPAYTSQVSVSLSQPLLRGFGSQANLAEIRIARNTHRTQIEQFRARLLEVVNATEGAYWNLLFARQILQIQERLLERGITTRDKLIGRMDYDVTQSEIALAKSRVENRRLAVKRARTDVLDQSDALKQLMNAPGLAVGDEVMIVPTDEFVADPVSFNYVDVVLTALRERPEVRQALLAMDDASTRQLLADNLRLPRLDLAAQIRWNGLDDSAGDAYGELTGSDFVEYILGLQFDIPIGNRQAESNYRRTRLQRMQTLIDYRRVVQNIVLEIKTALRAVRLRFALLQNTTDARIAAAESLRTLEVEEEFAADMTPEFLNLKFSRQEALAQAEVEEAQALIEYQIAMANLYFGMGTALERNQIDFAVPEWDEAASR